MLSFGKMLCCFQSSIATDEWSHTDFPYPVFLLRIEVLNLKCLAYTRNSFNACDVSSRFSSTIFSERAKFGNEIIQIIASGE